MKRVGGGDAVETNKNVGRKQREEETEKKQQELQIKEEEEVDRRREKEEKKTIEALRDRTKQTLQEVFKSFLINE